MKHSIELSEGSCFVIDERSRLVDMEQECPKFFRTKYGKRETYTIYRGCIIVRNTVQFTGGPKRTTAVYLFSQESRDVHCISADVQIDSIAQAKRRIDRVIEAGKYYYGFGSARFNEYSNKDIPATVV